MPSVASAAEAGSNAEAASTAAPLSTADYLLGAGAPADVALVEAGSSVTYAELRTTVNRMAACLSELGLPAGSRVGIMASNSTFWVAAYLAALSRYVAVPLSDKLTPTEIAGQAAFAGCRAVVVDRRHLKLYGEAFAGLPVVTEVELERADPASAPPPVEASPDADAALMFTSGTTARPKAVRITHRNLQSNTESIISYLGLLPSDRMLVVLPFYYCYGASLLHTHLRVGASVALCNTFTFPETAIAMLDRERCTGFAGVPSTYQLLLRASTFGSRELPSLRFLQQAGGKLSPVLIEELQAAQPQARLFVMYGQTEATARLSYLPPERLADKLGSVGRGIPGVTLEVLDEHGAPVPPGVTGEIVATGANISPGYLEDPEATAAKFPGGRLRTGDLAVVDEDGFISIVDRLDDFIKTWGYRVSSQEIEGAALRMHDLVSAAAVGVPDPEAGEAIELFVTVRPGAPLAGQDVLAFLRGGLARHMVPRHVHVLDSIPLNANGKVVKGSLRALALELDGAAGSTNPPSPKD